MIPEDAVDKAAAAFHDALDTHLDAPLASHHRETDWVTAPVVEVVEALLLSGWVPPTSDENRPDPPAGAVPPPRTGA